MHALRRPLDRRGAPFNVLVALPNDFDSVALRSTEPLPRKMGTVEKPGHFPDTSTILPWRTPTPASRSAALNSADVICGFRLNGNMGASVTYGMQRRVVLFLGSRE